MKNRLSFPVLLLALAVALMPTAVPAQGQGAFYFVGKAAPAGSLSAAGQGQSVVYLRWDVVEGRLPEDIQQFLLRRDGVEIGRFPASQIMPADEIASLYAGGAQQRRYLETLTTLKNIALGDDNISNFNASEFPSALRDRLLSDRAFAQLASRADINVAIARYRGFVDSTANGAHEYELLAGNAGGDLRRVGLIELDTNAPSQILPPQGFRQVSQGECDVLEANRDHFSVALTWQAPRSTSAADEVASRIFIGGYDLYRTKDNLDLTVTQAPPRNLAVEAGATQHASDGTLPFADLEKVNDVLLTIDGAQGSEAVFLETQNELAARGIRPGDRRAYYLVPRDIFGQYGPTQAWLVTVADLTRPPAPWDVRTYAEPGDPNDANENPRMELRWDAVNLASYQQTFLGRNQVCNPIDAQTSGILELVGPDENCNIDARRRVSTDVRDYRVFRFETFEEASKFGDADGDGVSNVIERAAIAAGQLVSGGQCDAQLRPAGAESALATDIQLTVETAPDGVRQIVRVEDRVPAQQGNVGEVYWYRIASVTPNDRQSLLSPPVRAIFPEREPPLPPTFTLETQGEENCDCALEVVDEDRAWRLRDGIGAGNRVGVSCAAGPRNVPLNFPIRKLDEASDVLCESIRSGGACTAAVTLDYPIEPADKGVPARTCRVSVPEAASFCRDGDVALVRKNCDRVPVEAGARIPGDLVITVNFPPGSCGSVLDNIAGQSTRIATSCGTDTPEQLVVIEDSGTICPSAYSQDENNDLSEVVRMGCVSAGGQRFEDLPPPQPVALEFGARGAAVSWRLPPEPVAVTVIELLRENNPGADGRVLVSEPLAGTPGVAQVFERDVELPPLTADSSTLGERWCVRLRAISPGTPGTQSDWTQPLCAPRAEGTVALPQFLPWPTVPEAPQGEPLLAISGADLPAASTLEERLAILITVGDAFGPFFGCDVVDLIGVSGPRQAGAFLEPSCDPDDARILRAGISEQFNFVVYRQARSPSGAISDLIEVSPMIERVHFDTVSNRGSVVPVSEILNDPYMKLIETGSVTGDFQFAFLDNYPRLAGYEYRYQLVYLTRDNRIRSWRQSNWVGGALDLAPAQSTMEAAQ